MMVPEKKRVKIRTQLLIFQHCASFPQSALNPVSKKATKYSKGNAITLQR